MTRYAPLAALLLPLVCTSAWSEPVTSIRVAGPAANRVDIAVLGDGYTAAELGAYASHVETFVLRMFGEEPLREYGPYFNVHRVDVVSNESGADHPSRGVARDTALDATYDCAGIERLICASQTKVEAVLARSLALDQRDIVLVLVNDTQYGGSGGAIAVASINEAVTELVLHELGHSFGLLADEYGGPPPPACDASHEPPEPNVTRAADRATSKWRLWIDPATPVPTHDQVPSQPGHYEGGRYCDTGLFRPTLDSKMRSLNRPFDQINAEQLVKRIYNFVSPIDATEPPASTIAVPLDGAQSFTAHVLQPLTHALAVTWTVDGQPAGTGPHFTLFAASVGPGQHVVRAVVTDPTPAVRNDPDGVLRETVSWTVSVSPVALHAAVLPSSRSVQVGHPATAFATILAAGPAGAQACAVSPVNLPAGATFLYQTTNAATNELTGSPNTPVDIPAHGSQSFLIAITPTAPVGPMELRMSFACAGVAAAPLLPGVNTLALVATTDAGPDIIALAATASNDGIVVVPAASHQGAFAVATVNVGAGADLTVSADTAGKALPLSLSVCRTDPLTGHCTSDLAAVVATRLDANSTATFSVFALAHGPVPFSPANNRIVLRFKDASGITRGSTSIAVKTE